jgi:hypothetical protein
MMSTRTIEEFLHELHRIADALERLSPAPIKSAETPVKPQNDPEPEKVETPEPTATPAETQERPNITIEQIRRMVVTLSAMGQEKKDAVREIVTSYGRNVSSIPADKYTEAMDRLTALKEV